MRDHNRADQKVAQTKIQINVNGKSYEVNVKPYDTLSRVLREELGLFGVKRGCDYGGCGACTVAIDDKAYYSCMYPVQYAVGRRVLTVEGLAKNEELSQKSLSEIQNGFLENGGLQCGYCTPGMMMATKCLLDKNPNPSLGEIQEGLSGNICRCTGYGRIIESVFAAAKERTGKRR